MRLEPGPLNTLTDVAGVKVGQAADATLLSGVTAVVFDEPAVASVDVRGGGPGTRETDLLLPERTVAAIDAICLSGGSAFGLDAAAGVVAALAEDGRGFSVGAARVPIVPAAILFDLLNGGDKRWGRYAPYRDLGYDAARNAASEFWLGSAGAGLGARTATLRGGVGSASSAISELGVTVGALAVVNAFGSAIVGDGPHFWASPFEIDDEFGGLGAPALIPRSAWFPAGKAQPGSHTTLAVVATDAIFTKAEAKALASVAHDGLARALTPCHTPLDGDIVFAASTGRVALPQERIRALGMVGHVAAMTLSRAVARGVYEAAESDPDGDAPPSWHERFGFATFR